MKYIREVKYVVLESIAYLKFANMYQIINIGRFVSNINVLPSVLRVRTNDTYTRSIASVQNSINTKLYHLGMIYIKTHFLQIS